MDMYTTLAEIDCGLRWSMNLVKRVGGTMHRDPPPTSLPCQIDIRIRNIEVSHYHFDRLSSPPLTEELVMEGGERIPLQPSKQCHEHPTG